MNPVKEIASSFTHLFFPHICVGCGIDLPHDNPFLCIHCASRLPLTRFEHFYDNPVEKIFRGRVMISAATSLYYFSKNSMLQQLMHRFKYQGKKQVGIYFGKILGSTLQQSNRFNSIDALVPLPLFASRERKRGYNQATLLCEGIASVLKIPVLQHSVIRAHSTETQTRKNRVDRWQNMSGNFEVADAASLKNKQILLVDDVVTTGATLDACATAVLEVVNCTISIATLAYTNI